jgi:hypothetical protein
MQFSKVKTLKLHGMQQAAGESTSQGSPRFEAPKGYWIIASYTLSRALVI